MMSTSSQQRELTEEIAKVRQQYIASLQAKSVCIHTLWSEIVDNGWSKSKVDGLGYELHSLSGSGQTFGFPQISEQAKSAERELKHLYSGKNTSTGQLDQIQQSITTLIDLISDKNSDKQHNSPYVPLAHKPIYILRRDNQQSMLLEKELIARDYRVIVCQQKSQLYSSIENNGSGLIVLDLIYGSKNNAGLNILSKIRENQSTYAPAIFICSENTVETRLTAIKFGGDAFFPNDFQMIDLLDKIDHMTARFNAEAYRILLVDDDKVLSKIYLKFLSKAGLTVECIDNPLDILSKIVDFGPDIVLLDNEMPHCTGLEIAKLLRQHEAHYKLPIIFLTADQSLKTAFKAREFGASDYLTKPIQEEFLITSVVNHAQKARMFNQEISLDSMTGLLSHEMFEIELQRQLKQLARSKQSLCFCMLDLDNFKLVNDNFGHLMGDTVLKNFANLLKEKFRSTDIIGRYGGEEFAIIFPSTHIEEARELLESLRMDYQKSEHITGNQKTFNTVSIGLSETNGERSYLELIDSADKALYRAKSSGRNRTELDPDTI